MKKIVSVILTAAALAGMLTAFAAGTKSDPLITKSYAEGEYRASLNDLIIKEAAKISPAIKIRLSAIEEVSGFEFAPGHEAKQLGIRDELSLSPGSSFTLESGTASVIFASGSVINVSTGKGVNSGTALVKGQRYFCGSKTDAIIVASATSYGYVDGYHKITISQTTKFVERLYREVLSRRYDENGLQVWARRLAEGMSVTEIAYRFVFCEEVKNKNLSNADFVEMLYRAILGRKSDEAGKNRWISELNKGMTREQLFNRFAESKEFAMICEQYGLGQDSDAQIPAGVRVFVTRLYLECLERSPDLTGRARWMNEIRSGSMTGSQVAHRFVFSDESNKRNLSNADFVELLYRTMLGRNSDSAGKQTWVKALDSGMSRETLFQRFADSTEFASICKTLGVPK